jgi:hypothetical protein
VAVAPKKRKAKSKCSYRSAIKSYDNEGEETMRDQEWLQHDNTFTFIESTR